MGSRAEVGVEIVEDAASGLWAAIAIDRLVGGVAAGGIRIRAYPDGDAAAADARALARAMSTKAALAGVRCGGAKVAMRADLLRDRPAALERLGRRVEELGGSLYVGPDFGFTAEDRDAVARGTRFVDEESIADRMAGATAAGVRDCLAAALGRSSLDGMRIGIQGLGKVGSSLARLLLAEGAEVAGFDVDRARTVAAGVRPVEERALFDEEWDAIAPCALGGAIDLARAERLRARAVVGAANHLLAPPEGMVAATLAHRGIIHVPDFLANSGALVLWASVVLDRRPPEKALLELGRIGAMARDVLARATAEKTTPFAIAQAIAEERLKG